MLWALRSGAGFEVIADDIGYLSWRLVVSTMSVFEQELIGRTSC